MDTISRWTDRTRPGSAALLLGVALVVAACSGSGGGATAAPGGNGTPAPAATQGTQPTDAAGATAEPTGGGAAGNVCDLVSSYEMAAAIGVGSTTTKFLAGPPDTCGYYDGASPVVGIILTPVGGQAAFDAMAADTGSTKVSGIGDQALYNESAKEFLVLKGGKLIVIALTAENLPGEWVDVAKQIATVAAGRL